MTLKCLNINNQGLRCVFVKYDSLYGVAYCDLNNKNVSDMIECEIPEERAQMLAEQLSNCGDNIQAFIRLERNEK